MGYTFARRSNGNRMSLCDERYNPPSLLDLGPASAVSAQARTAIKMDTHSAFRETKRAFTIKGSFGSLQEPLHDLNRQPRTQLAFRCPTPFRIHVGEYR